jgi:hypothetical protein
MKGYPKRPFRKLGHLYDDASAYAISGQLNEQARLFDSNYWTAADRHSISLLFALLRRHPHALPA